MEKNSGNDPIEEGSALVPAEASLALAAPFQDESLVDALGFEEVGRSSWMDSAIHQQLDDTFASIGVENQAYQGDQLAYDPELDALYAYEQQGELMTGS
ncbi:hypothetical protein PGT21_031134 [Puccinia graminis f. sp. tritici]|uniref:Uncharacterized protein n=1 Tax=Puccinia graminis f. sp. tritici TaxID=56615 RepID=A0A5B0M141_PUCGR|nr:hypothetical protein PGT21_031134 [Puccinia graminis f. sp. tritici]